MLADDPVRPLAAVAAILVGLCQPALAWDYATDGTNSIYAGHSTAQFDNTETASLAFACTKSAIGAIMFLLETSQTPIGDAQDTTVTIDVGGDRFEVEAVLVDAGGRQNVMTWGRHAPVNAVVRRIYQSDSEITIALGSTEYTFPGPGKKSTDFAKMLAACGGPSF